MTNVGKTASQLVFRLWDINVRWIDFRIVTGVLPPVPDRPVEPLSELEVPLIIQNIEKCYQDCQIGKLG